MNIHIEHTYAATVEQVGDMYANEEFSRLRAFAAGAHSADADVEGDAAGAFTVTIRRVVPTHAIPPEFRKLLGSTLTVRSSEAWQASNGVSRLATFAIDIAGVPAMGKGTVVLAPEGSGATFTLSGNVESSVPLFGPMVASAVAQAMTDALEKEFVMADGWLAEQ